MNIPNNDWSSYMHYLFSPAESLYNMLHGFYVGAAGWCTLAAVLLVIAVALRALVGPKPLRTARLNWLRGARLVHRLQRNTLIRH